MVNSGRWLWLWEKKKKWFNHVHSTVDIQDTYQKLTKTGSSIQGIRQLQNDPCWDGCIEHHAFKQEIQQPEDVEWFGILKIKFRRWHSCYLRILVRCKKLSSPRLLRIKVVLRPWVVYLDNRNIYTKGIHCSQQTAMFSSSVVKFHPHKILKL